MHDIDSISKEEGKNPTQKNPQKAPVPSGQISRCTKHCSATRPTHKKWSLFGASATQYNITVFNDANNNRPKYQEFRKKIIDPFPAKASALLVQFPSQNSPINPFHAKAFAMLMQFPSHTSIINPFPAKAFVLLEQFPTHISIINPFLCQSICAASALPFPEQSWRQIKLTRNIRYEN